MVALTQWTGMLLCMYGAELAEHILQQFAAKKKKSDLRCKRKKERKEESWVYGLD